MTDKAERLHGLIERIRDTANAHSLGHKPLYQSIDSIAQILNFGDYCSLNEHYLDLCSSIKDEIYAIPLAKESVRESFVGCVTSLRGVFDARNFSVATLEVFQNHFSRNLPTLDVISERFQTSGILESTDLEIEEALLAVKEAIFALRDAGDIDHRIVFLLMHHLRQMEMIYENYEILGDDKFWKVYKETFATFVQIHGVISSSKDEKKIREKITNAAKKLMSKSLSGVSLVANLLKISEFFHIDMLPPG
jgi:hypothetical protein